MEAWDRIRTAAWRALAFTRIPGNALSYSIRKTLRWSRGRPELWQEDKTALFGYLGPGAADAEARERGYLARYDLGPLKALSTANLYRKSLYLIECLEKACEGLPPLVPVDAGAPLRAADAGSQDWHYVFGLERWLRGPAKRAVDLTGIELDGHGVYPDFRSRKDYAEAYAAQTGNPAVRYVVADFLDWKAEGLDLVTLFYPFVTRYALLLWGLPIWHFAPERMVSHAAALLRPGGRLIVFNHTAEEHGLFMGLGKASGRLELLKEGPVRSDLVDFHQDTQDRRYSIWRRTG
jgi:SAM-dependent methyltransferase